MIHQIKKLLILSIIMVAVSCSQKNNTKMGSYNYDKAFLQKHHIKFIELKSSDDLSRLLVIPGWQGRVLTSTAAGEDGMSFGWINYSFIESGKQDPQFNAYGGEERFWLGPEGGPFSLYFGEGAEQVFENWVVPPVIDTETYDIKSIDDRGVKFAKEAVLKNTLGTEFRLGIERSIALLNEKDVSSLLQVKIPENVQMVAYESENIITNRGRKAWTKEKGLLSIWMLCMFNPSPDITVFIPYKPEGDGVVVNDDYFGKVPADRITTDSNTVYFKIDGKFRSKIGIPPARAKNLCGSYDSGKKVLTLLWCSLPGDPMSYVNSKWGEQDDSYNGDAINSYNDGPVEDGSIMGPFYEIESSSPAAELKPGGTMKHIQRVIHIRGSEEELAGLTRELFDLDLKSIAGKFK